MHKIYVVAAAAGLALALSGAAHSADRPPLVRVAVGSGVVYMTAAEALDMRRREAALPLRWRTPVAAMAEVAR